MPDQQRGYVYGANNAWHIRYYAHELRARRQKSARLCAKDSDHPSKDAPSVAKLAEEFMSKINTANGTNDGKAHNCPLCGGRCKRNVRQQFAPKEL